MTDKQFAAYLKRVCSQLVDVYNAIADDMPENVERYTHTIPGVATLSGKFRVLNPLDNYIDELKTDVDVLEGEVS